VAALVVVTIPVYDGILVGVTSTYNRGVSWWVSPQPADYTYDVLVDITSIM
jgi:hypothetical protein